MCPRFETYTALSSFVIQRRHIWLWNNERLPQRRIQKRFNDNCEDDRGVSSAFSWRHESFHFMASNGWFDTPTVPGNGKSFYALCRKLPQIFHRSVSDKRKDKHKRPIWRPFSLLVNSAPSWHVFEPSGRGELHSELVQNFQQWLLIFFTCQEFVAFNTMYCWHRGLKLGIITYRDWHVATGRTSSSVIFLLLQLLANEKRRAVDLPWNRSTQSQSSHSVGLNVKNIQPGDVKTISVAKVKPGRSEPKSDGLSYIQSDVCRDARHKI